jgi:MazG family protein
MLLWISPQSLLPDIIRRLPSGLRVFMTSEENSPAGEKFQKLVAIMARLRSPHGCPWDREQTFDTIKPYLLEESYEVIDAIDARDWRELTGELGDLLLQAVFFAQMAAEEGHFRIEDSLDDINEKLVRRHPHIFGEAEAHTAEDVKRRWDEIKAEERKAKNAAEELLLDSVPKNLPALMEAAQIHSKAARAGFNWRNAEEVLQKLEEELRELREARHTGRPEKLEHEIGDVLAVVVNLARFLHVDPEQALRKGNKRVRRRFAYVETALRREGRSLADSDIDEMEALWQEAKRSE